MVILYIFRFLCMIISKFVLGVEQCLRNTMFHFPAIWFRAAVLAERYWSSNATIARECPGGCSYMTPGINARLVKHRCRLLQRGIHAQPYDTQIVPQTSRWSQCELFLPTLVHEIPH